jgi:DNA-binding IclR family transcriptional regulator
LLETLVELGAVEQGAPGGHYRLGPAMVALSGAAQPTQRLVDGARPHLVELVGAVGEAAGLSVLDGNEVVYLDQVSAPGDIQVRVWTGERLRPHLVSSGFVLLATAPPSVVDACLSEPLIRPTSKTMVDPTMLRRRFVQAGVDGHAWVIDELTEGLSSVAVPVLDGRGSVVAAVHLHGPSFRFPGASASTITAKLQSAAERITKNL